ncbi:hypothetical protein AB3M93_19545 [Novosphingobium panipatense]|uniref:hypothetical protein n=1 Tax=Novosphingobium panipatense TaxID=428991 RepID=UPI00399F4B57
MGHNQTFDGSAAGEHVYQVDPFNRFPNQASRIDGVAGDQPLPFDAYVFHGAPIEVPGGSLRFTLHLPGLQAGSQILLLEVINRSSVPGSAWSRLKIEGVHLSDVIANGGVWHIDVEGWPQVQYACAGYIHDEGALSAQALLLTVNMPFRVATPAPLAEAPQHTATDQPSHIAVRPRIAGPQTPSFANPSSQPWTLAQTREPAFREQMLKLGRSEQAPADPWAWADAIILQIFDRYQTVFPKARGLAIDIAEFTLAANILKRDCPLTLLRIETDFAVCFDAGASIDELATRHAEHRAEILRAVNITTVNPGNIPEDFERQFNFAWWVAPKFTTRLDVQNVLHVLMKGLRAGGMLVLVMPFSRTVPVSPEEAGGLTRTDIERLTLDTISHGHDVAQLRFNTSEEDQAFDPVPYALIARRGDD